MGITDEYEVCDGEVYTVERPGSVGSDCKGAANGRPSAYRLAKPGRMTHPWPRSGSLILMTRTSGPQRKEPSLTD